MKIQLAHVVCHIIMLYVILSCCMSYYHVTSLFFSEYRHNINNVKTTGVIILWREQVTL